MLVQEAMIERVRELCRADNRVVAALMYGSFVHGEGDEFSDIEFVLFIRDDALKDLDQREWVEQIAPVELYYADDFGHYTAIFGNLVRGEFHFNPASGMSVVDTWQGSVFFSSPESCIIVDRTGELGRRLEPLYGLPGDRGAGGRAASIQMMFANGILFGWNTLSRGEVARAADILGMVDRYLLWMARLVEGRTQHWPTPLRGLEHDLSPGGYARYAACTASANRAALTQAYRSAWAWGSELGAALTQRYGPALPDTLIGKISARLGAE